MSTYGLPRQVITFLRHLEAYKEFLKWDISEGTHKITLTLCWNFHKHGVRESLWAKLQRTLHLNRAHNASESVIPQDLSRLLEVSPKRSRRSGSIGRQLNWARISSISLPSRWRHHQHHSASSPGAGGGGVASRNSFPKESTSEHGSLLPRSSPSRLSLPVSPSRYSWHGVGQPSTPTDPAADLLHGATPITSTPDSVRSSSQSPSHVRISYRSEEEIARSMEDLARRIRERNQAELESIRTEWNRAIADWPKLVTDPCELNTSSEPTDNSEDNVNLELVNDTVQRCLQTCDSILDKHSTLIL